MKHNGTRCGNRTRNAFFVSCGLILIIAARPLPTSAQDLKPISNVLAAQISASGRKTVAVVDFTDLEGNVTKLGRFFAEEVSVDLVGNAKNFEVIDRTHLKVILQENRLSTTGLIDPQTARKLGQIAGADALVTGTITPLGDSVRLSAKVLDTQTAKMIAASTTDIPKTPAIVGLMSEASPGAQAPSPTTSSSSDGRLNTTTPVAPASVQANSFIFAARGCTRSYDTLNCSGVVVNKGEHRLLIINQGPGGSGFSNVVDDEGNQYVLDGGRTGKLVFGANDVKQEMETDLPISFSLSVQDFKSVATHVSIVLLCFTDKPYLYFTVALKNVPIQMR